MVLNLLKAGRAREEILMEHVAPRLQAEIVASTGNGLLATQKGASAEPQVGCSVCGTSGA